jgi:hypothetical protein
LEGTETSNYGTRLNLLMRSHTVARSTVATQRSREGACVAS